MSWRRTAIWCGALFVGMSLLFAGGVAPLTLGQDPVPENAVVETVDALPQDEVVETPVVQDPVVEEEPVVEEPVVEEPVVEEPVVEEPVVEEPIVEEPVVEEPIVEEPVVEEPVVEEPIVEEPIVEDPVVVDADDPVVVDADDPVVVDADDPVVVDTDDPVVDADDPVVDADDPVVVGDDPTDDAESTDDDTSETSIGQGSEEEDEGFKWSWAGFFVILITIGMLVLPWVIAVWITKKVGMPEYTARIWAILFCLSAGLLVIATREPTLGIDLRGGVILVYEVEGTPDYEGNVEVDMDKMVTAIKDRVDPSGTREISVQRLGPDEIMVSIPEVDQEEVARLEHVISDAGSLEFRILAHRDVDEDQQLIDLALQSQAEQVLDPVTGRRLGWWVTVMYKEEGKFPEPGDESSDSVTRRVEDGSLEVLVIQDTFNVTGGDHLESARDGIDDEMNRCVNFTLNTRGSSLFAQMTNKYRPDEATGRSRYLGIVLRDQMKSAPAINSVIRGDGQITGEFTEEEVKDLIAVLDAGSLPAKLSEAPVSSLHTEPTLGAATIASGKRAIIFSAVIVLLFMVVYYNKAGVVACFAVGMNLVMILGVMYLVHAAFTLAGLAGLVLTVGMAVDANVLIFERIREELDKNATLRMAIRNGFQRAWTTIFDANLTTLITAVILWSVGSEQIKGFAVTLFLGVLFSMFTSIYCSRAIFEIAERKHWLKSLKMRRIIGKTEIDFMKYRNKAIVASSIAILIGLGGVALRGKGLLDIDFVGGVQVELVFNESQNDEEIEDRLSEVLEDPSVTQVARIESSAETVEEGDTIEGKTENHFLLTTACPPDKTAADYKDIVESELQKAYADDLTYFSMTYENLESAEPVDESVSDACTVDLSFPFKTSYQTLDGYLEQHIGPLYADGLLSAMFNYVITNDNEAFDGVNDTTMYENWTVTVDTTTENATVVLDSIQTQLAETPYFPSSNTIGGSIAADTRSRAAWALGLALISIIGYVWFRFHGVIFGIAAVVALIHDVLIALGVLAISKWLALGLGFMQVEEFKIGLPVLAAFLTIIGYSLNDTIVVFDRIREVRGKSPKLSSEMINTSVNQTLSRTLLTSMTTLFVVVVLFLIGGSGIHTFAFTLVTGVIVGTYSSVFIASPVLHWLFEFSEKRSQLPR